jgi:MYXO-CTERM domain-containing protein
LSVQNANDGWGRTQGLASSIVNTVEAVYVLKCAGEEQYQASIEKGLGFISKVTSGAIANQSRSRYAFFALEAVINSKQYFSTEFVNTLVDWLFEARNPDGGWGHEARDGKSCLYPTVMSILRLVELGHRNRLDTAVNWIVSKKQPTGWAFSSLQPPNHVATSMAVVALRKFRDEDDKIFADAKSDLLTIDSWTTAKEDQPGADWVHSAHMWGFAALTRLGLEPYIKPIAEGVRQINSLACDQGWREPDGHLTVRGQYWATMAFEALQEGFDPAVHVYRIDAARAHSFTLEPEFVHIRPHTRWTTVVPSRVYVAVTYLLFSFSAFFFLGVNRLIPEPPPIVDFVGAVTLFGLGWLFVRRRRRYFPRWFMKPLLGFFAVLSIIDIVFGISLTEVWRWIQTVRAGSP